MFYFIDRIASFLLAALGVILLAMVSISIWNVVSRHVFGEALLWADEINTYLLIILTYLGALVCAWRDIDLRMDVLVSSLPDRIQNIVRIVQQLVTFGLTGWVGWISCGYVVRLYEMGFKSTAAEVPLWLVNAILPASLLLISLVALTRFLLCLFGKNDFPRSTIITTELASK